VVKAFINSLAKAGASFIIYRTSFYKAVYFRLAKSGFTRLSFGLDRDYFTELFY